MIAQVMGCGQGQMSQFGAVEIIGSELCSAWVGSRHRMAAQRRRSPWYALVENRDEWGSLSVQMEARVGQPPA